MPGIPLVGGHTGLVSNVTATSPTSNGWLTAYPSSVTLSVASTLNFGSNQTVANLSKLGAGANGTLAITNNGGVSGGGTVQIIVDVVGYFV